ncbi:MAG: hypothetical protein AAF628_10795 [Planctomycetota bacterium]
MRTLACAVLTATLLGVFPCARLTAQPCDPSTGGNGTSTVVASGIPVPGPMPRTTADVLQIDCDGVPAIGVTIQITEPPPGTPVRGTIVFSTGDIGVTFFSSEFFGLPLFQTLSDLGFRLVDRAWVPGWFSHPVSVRKQSCRYATLLRYVHDQYHTTGIFGAFGSSGGAAEISYGLTTWDTDDLLDVAVLGGGPPMTRLDYFCPQPPTAAWLAQCAQLVPPYLLECSPLQCTGIQVGFGLCQRCSPTATPDELREDSILHSDAVLDYPNTRIHVLSGAQDCFDGVPSAMLFYQAITSEKIIEFIPGAPHFVVLTAEGRDSIVRALVGAAACAPIGPASLNARAWPQLGGTLELDGHGRPGETFFVFGSVTSTTFEIRPFGWLFLGNPFLWGAAPLDASGRGTLQVPVAPLPALTGFEVYFQALVGPCLSNMARIEFLP